MNYVLAVYVVKHLAIYLLPNYLKLLGLLF